MTDPATPFASRLRQLRSARGLSLRQLAERVHHGKSYLSELERGLKPPTRLVAQSLDEGLDAEGQLVRLVPDVAGHESTLTSSILLPAAAPDGPMGEDDIERLRGTVRHLVALDTLNGSDGLAASSARAFKTAQRKLATRGVRPAARGDLLVALAELGEVAAWLAFDSEQQELSRHLAVEATLIAQAGGDVAMQRFLASHLSMQAIHLDRPAEALELAGRVLADDPRSRRVTGMMRVRRARSLARLGGAGEALRELRRAQSELENGVGPEDPPWTWWWHSAELARHESHLRFADGDARQAVAASERAVLQLPPRQGRDHAVFRADLISDLVEVAAWRDAERVVAELITTAPGVGSARIPRIVRRAERRARRAGAPAWLIDAMREAAKAADPAG